MLFKLKLDIQVKLKGFGLARVYWAQTVTSTQSLFSRIKLEGFELVRVYWAQTVTSTQSTS